MIYEINQTWTEEMKWKCRSEHNLYNCVKKPEKKIQDSQRGLNPWPHDTGAMLYQLSYEATDVGSRSIVGSYVPVKEMSVNDIWNKSYMNCGNEISGFFTQLHKLRSLRRSFLHFQKFSLFFMFRCFKKPFELTSRSDLLLFILVFKYIFSISKNKIKPN